MDAVLFNFKEVRYFEMKVMKILCNLVLSVQKLSAKREYRKNGYHAHFEVILTFLK